MSDFFVNCSVQSVYVYVLMKKKEVKTNPQKIDQFFFKHIREDEDKDCQGDDNTDVDCALWGRYAPVGYKEAVARIKEEESKRTALLEEKVSLLWSDVEELLERNKHLKTLRDVDSGLLEKELETVGQISFWNANDIVKRFKIGSLDEDAEEQNEPSRTQNLTTAEAAAAAIDTDTGDASEARAADRSNRVTFNFTTKVELNERNETENSRRVTKALHMTDAELLNPALQPYSLRRNFSPLLQRRETLPRQLTMLLDEIKQVQSEDLPPLEEGIKKNILFNIPLHRPFEIISKFITCYLTVGRLSESIEENTVRFFQMLFKNANELYQQISKWSASDSVRSGGIYNPDEILVMLESMWMGLFEDAKMRRQFHFDTMQQIEYMSSNSKSVSQEAENALAECEKRIKDYFTQLHQDALKCAGKITLVGGQTLAVVRESEKFHEVNVEKLKSSIQSKTYALEKSERNQEKLARRLRETMKELYLEQARHDETMQEWLQEKLALAQIEASYQQLRDAVETRYQAALDAEQQAGELHELIQKADLCASKLIASSRRHLQRMDHDDFYRQCHVATELSKNFSRWDATVSQIHTLYAHRHAQLAKKSASTWQMNYLIAGELETAQRNLEFALAEEEEVEKERQRLGEVLVALDMDFLSDEAQAREAATATEQLVSIDARFPKLHRNIMTWKSFLETQRKCSPQGSSRQAAKLLSSASLTQKEMEATTI